VADNTVGMRGTGVNLPADVAPDAANRTGGSRLLLDELLAERERAHEPVPAPPPPGLTVDPVAVPPNLDNSRKAVRQRMLELENAAMRNYHSAEEAHGRSSKSMPSSSRKLRHVPMPSARWRSCGASSNA